MKTAAGRAGLPGGRGDAAVGAGSCMNTSIFFQSDFYRQADELSAALVRVEAVWADRFQPSWMIFVPSVSRMWQKVGESFVDGFVAGVRKGAWLTRVTAEIHLALHGRWWFQALPEWAQHWIIARRFRAREQQEDRTGGDNR